MNQPTAIMVPFGYPGYPPELIRRFKNASSRFLRRLGINLAATSTVIDFPDSRKVIEEIRQQDFDFLIALVVSWVEAPNVIEVVKEYAHKPILLWSHTMFEEKGERLFIGPFPAAAVLRQTFEEMGWRFRFVYGQPGEGRLKREIPPFARAAAAVHRMQHSRIGLLGYAAMGMYTGCFDHVALRRDLGPEVDQLDQYVLIKRADSVKNTEVAPLIARGKKEWELGESVCDKDLAVTLKMYVALKQLVAERHWDILTVKCQYELSKEYGYMPCVPLSLLGNEMPCACEGDIPLAATLLVLHYLTGEITSFGDVFTVEDDRLLMGMCGIAPYGLGVGKPKIDRSTALYEGLGSCISYKEGEITIARIALTAQRNLQMHVACGEARTPRPFREVGCLPYPSLELVLHDSSGDRFAQQIKSQHYAIVYGDVREDLKEFCKLAHLEMIT